MSLNSGFITQGISKSISDHFNAQPGYVGRMLSTIAGITTYTTGSVGGMNNQGIWLEADGTTKFYAFQGKYAFAFYACLLYTSPSPRDVEESRMPSSA